MAINPNFHAPERQHWDVPALAEGIRRGDRSALARGITLVESDLSADQGPAAELLTRLQSEPSDQTPSFRLGLDLRTKLLPSDLASRATPVREKAP